MLVAENGDLRVTCPHYDWPERARRTVHLGRELKADDFRLAAPDGAETVRARVIGVVENQAPTKALVRELPVEEGSVMPEGPVARIALVERHRGTGGVVNGFVEGFGYEGRMAIASTVAHDSHHMIVGVTVWRDDAERALVRLPIAGLMSDAPAREVAAQADAMVAAMRDTGCTLNNAYMQHSLLALVVIPELRISDLGLVDVTRFEITGPVEGQD